MNEHRDEPAADRSPSEGWPTGVASPAMHSPAQLDDLFGEYDELASDVSRSTHMFFQGNLKRWLDFLDRTSPFARPILQQLETSADFKTWFEPYRLALMGHATKNIEWPPDRRRRLGLQLLLFREFANGSIQPGIFALTILHTGRNINDGISGIVDQIFVPMSRELRRYLATTADESVRAEVYAPASDRVVSLDHNSEAYTAAVRALEKVEEAVEQANDYPDREDKEQRLTELSAGRRLLKAVRVRPKAVMAVAGASLLWLIEKFAGGMIGQAAASAWQALKSLLG